VRLTWAAHFVAREAGRKLNPVAKRVLGYAFSLFACFAGAALVLLAGEVDSSVNEGDASSIAYFALDVAAYVIVLLMLRGTVNACLVKPGAKFMARAKKASWMNNTGEGDDYDDDFESDESSTSRSTSSSASSSGFGDLNKPLRTASISGKVRFGANASGLSDDAAQAEGVSSGPLLGFEDGEVGAVGGGSWTLLEDPTEPVGKYDLVKDVEMFDENGKSFVPALFKRFIKRQTEAQAEAEARAAAAAAAAIGWQLFGEFSEPIGPNDEVKEMEVFDADGNSFSPPVFKTFVKRSPVPWVMYEDLEGKPLRLGDEVRQVEVLDAQGNSFEPKQFRKEVRRAQNTWQMLDLDAIDSAKREGKTVRDLELYDENGNSFEPKRFATCARVDETSSASSSAASTPRKMEKKVNGWQIFFDHSEPLQSGDQVKVVELLDHNGQSFEPALFRRMVKRAADAAASSSSSSPVSSPRNAKVQAKVGHGWQLYFDPNEQARAGDETVLVEQLDPNGQSFTPACFKRVIKRKVASPPALSRPRSRSDRPMLPAAPAVREPIAAAGKDHAWIVLDDASEEATNVPASEIVSVEQFDENGLPYNPPMFKRFVRKPQVTLPPIHFKGSTVLYHLNKMKAAGSVTATKPGEIVSPPAVVDAAPMPNTVNQPSSPLLSAEVPPSEPDVIEPTPRSGSSGEASVTQSSPRSRALINAAVLAGPGLREALVKQTYGKFAEGSPILGPSAAASPASAAATAPLEPSGSQFDDESDDDDVSGTYTGSSGSEDDDEEFSQTASRTTTSVSRRASKHHLKRIVSATLEVAAAKAEAMHAGRGNAVAASEVAVHTAMARMQLDEKVKQSAAEAQRAAERDWVQNQLNSAEAAEDEVRRLESLRVGSLQSPSLRASPFASPSLHAAGIDDDEVEFGIGSPQHRPTVARRMLSGSNRAVASSAAAAFLKGVTAAASSKSPSGARVSPGTGSGFSSPGGARSAAAPRVPMSPAPNMSVPALSAQMPPPLEQLPPSRQRASSRTAPGSAAAAAAAALASPGKRANK